MHRDGRRIAYPVEEPGSETATCGLRESSSPQMRRLPAILAVTLTALLAAPAAQAATSLVLRGAGFGHGVGMSQYGTLGFSQHGWDYRRILGYYYQGTAIGKLGAAPPVRVLLRSGHSRYSVSGAAASGALRLDPSLTYDVTTADGHVVLRHGSDDVGQVDGTLRLSAPAGGAVTLAGGAVNGLRDGSYRGSIDITRSGSGLIAVNTVPLEQYVAGVISAEVSASWPAEALKVQAVAARSYALTTNAGGLGALFTQYADTRSQMYRGVSAEHPSTNAAAAATAGEVVTYAGEPVTTYFFSTSGGRTENVENSFVGSDPKPWLKSVPDPYDNVSPVHRWGPLTFTRADAARRLAGYVQGRFRKIRVTQRGVSPRIVRAEVVGTTGTSAITGPQLRRAFGLRDAWIVFRTFSTDVTKRRPVAPPATTPAAPDPGAKVGGPGPGSASTARVPRLLLHGRISPAQRGRWATVERRVGTTWIRAVDVLLADGGRYRTTLPGPGDYRVRFGDELGPVVTAR